jgi:hypothetical protein
VKNGTPSVQPLGGVDLRALRKLKREERGESEEFPLQVHPHMLRHCLRVQKNRIARRRLRLARPPGSGPKGRPFDDPASGSNGRKRP